MSGTFPTVVLVLAAPFAARQDAVRSTTDLYPGDSIVERGGERWLCRRIVDDASGRPIAGAELFLVKESLAPIAGEFWSTRSATSDADGFVRVRIDDIEGQWDIQVLRADGHGVSSRSSSRAPIWRMAAAQDVPVLVRDWRGLPVAGAVIGFCGSCGHGPDLVHATSGADGIAILRGVDPHNDIADLYCQARGLELGYQSLEWRPGDAPFELECAYSTPLTGKLLDHAGNAIAHAFVGTSDVHRGPWAKTRADGSFELLGAPEGSWLMARVGEREISFPGAATYPAVLRVPAGDSREGTVDQAAPKSPPEIAMTSIAVRVEGAESGVDVWASSPSLGASKAENGSVHVPTSGPFVLQVGARRVVYAGLDELPPQPIVLADHAPTIVRGAVVDASGRAVPVRASLRVGDDERATSVDAPGGAFELAVRKTGTVLLELHPEREDLRPRRLYIALPARGDAARVDLGRIALDDTPRLRVLDRNGAPRTDVSVTFSRAGFFEIGSEPRFALDANGGWTGPDPRSGDVIVVATVLPDDAEDVAEERRIAVPYRTTLQGDGPWTITPPTSALRLVVRGLASGERAHALFADQVFDVADTSEFTSLAPGPLEMWISARGRQTVIVTTTITATETKAIHVALEPL